MIIIIISVKENVVSIFIIGAIMIVWLTCYLHTNETLFQEDFTFLKVFVSHVRTYVATKDANITCSQCTI